MKASVCFEFIGSEQYAREQLAGWIFSQIGEPHGKPPSSVRKPWVAEITGLCEKYGYERKFVKYKTQYVRGSGNCNRGVEMWFILESGKIYQAQCFSSWKKRERSFLTVNDDGDVKEVTEEWVKNILKQTS